MSAPPNIAFLHGFGGAARSWDLVRARLDGFNCYAPTLRGFAGEEDVLPGWDLACATTDALSRLSAAGLPRDAPFVLVGHSMGGKLALAVAMQHVAGLKALVLLAPSPAGVEPMTADDRAEALRSHGDRGYAERIAGIVGRHWRDDTRQRFIDDTLAVHPRAWAWWYGAGSREPLALATRDLPAHVAVAVGSHDVTIPPAEQRRFTDTWPPAALTIVSDAAHMLPYDAASPSADLIIAAAAS